MKKLLVLFFVAAMCAPSYGDIFVYKFKGQSNPVVRFTDDSYSSATVSVGQTTGYMVSDIDVETGGFNDTPTLIIYDGKAKWYYLGDINGDLSSFYAFDIESDKGFAGRGLYAQIVMGNVDVGIWQCPLYGKCSLIDIGRIDKRKVWTPKSLKGVTIVMLTSPTIYNAFGNMAMTLNSKYTQNANKTEATQEDTVDKICADLEGKGYGPG